MTTGKSFCLGKDHLQFFKLSCIYCTGSYGNILILSIFLKTFFIQFVRYFNLFRLKEFAKLYDVIKNERNKCVNLIQTSTQKSAEMKEKIKILHNEIEILRTAVMQKDKYEVIFYILLLFREA